MRPWNVRLWKQQVLQTLRSSLSLFSLSSLLFLFWSLRLLELLEMLFILVVWNLFSHSDCLESRLGCRVLVSLKAASLLKSKPNRKRNRKRSKRNTCLTNFYYYFLPTAFLCRPSCGRPWSPLTFWFIFQDSSWANQRDILSTSSFVRLNWIRLGHDITSRTKDFFVAKCFSMSPLLHFPVGTLKVRAASWGFPRFWHNAKVWPGSRMQPPSGRALARLWKGAATILAIILVWFQKSSDCLTISLSLDAGNCWITWRASPALTATKTLLRLLRSFLVDLFLGQGPRTQTVWPPFCRPLRKH